MEKSRIGSSSDDESRGLKRKSPDTDDDEFFFLANRKVNTTGLTGHANVCKKKRVAERPVGSLDSGTSSSDGARSSSGSQDGETPGLCIRLFACSSSSSTSSKDRQRVATYSGDDEDESMGDDESGQLPLTQSEPLNLALKNDVQPDQMEVVEAGSRKRKREVELAVVQKVRCVGRVGKTDFDLKTDHETWINPHMGFRLQIVQNDFAQQMICNLENMDI